MEVQIFGSSWDYKEWLETRTFAIEIQSVIVFDEEIVITFKRK
jgi:hypothetical protein